MRDQDIQTVISAGIADSPASVPSCAAGLVQMARTCCDGRPFSHFGLCSIYLELGMFIVKIM